MKHPTPEQLKPLLQAVDTAVWAWAVKSQTRRGNKVRVNWKNALQELTEAYHMFELTTDDSVLVPASPDGGAK